MLRQFFCRGGGAAIAKVTKIVARLALARAGESS